MRNRELRVEMIKSKIIDIEESITLVKENLPQSAEDFSKLGLVKDGIYMRIEFSIENIIDICSIINFDLELGMPESDENIIDNLVGSGILTEDLGEKVQKMNGFGDLLVHRYGRIDDSMAYSFLVDRMNDFYKFIESIEKFLKTHSEGR